MVGALARINNNATQLNPQAKKTLKKARVDWPSFNPFYNILAQSIELMHCVEEAKKLLHQLLLKDLSENDLSERESIISARLKSIKNSVSASAAIEAPRGTLYYFYEIENGGKIKNCNIITPTSQNMARLERDLEEYLPKIIAKKMTKKEIEEKIKILIRAYDPCITCATH
jgi:coenzyme F420-reducing hydrogenase alpha subunit